MMQKMKTAYTFTCKSNDKNKYTHVFSYLCVYNCTTMVLIYTNLLHHHAASLHNSLHIHSGSLEFCTIKGASLFNFVMNHAASLHNFLHDHGGSIYNLLHHQGASLQK